MNKTQALLERSLDFFIEFTDNERFNHPMYIQARELYGDIISHMRHRKTLKTYKKPKEEKKEV